MNSSGYPWLVYIVFTCVWTKYISFCDEHRGKTTSNNAYSHVKGRAVISQSTLTLVPTSNFTQTLTDLQPKSKTKRHSTNHGTHGNTVNYRTQTVTKNSKIHFKTTSSRMWYFSTISSTWRLKTNSRTQSNINSRKQGQTTYSTTQGPSRSLREQETRTHSGTHGVASSTTKFNPTSLHPPNFPKSSTISDNSRIKISSSLNIKETSTPKSEDTHTRSNFVKVSILQTSTEMPVPGGRFIYAYTVTNIDVLQRTYNVSVDVDNYMLNAWVTKPTFVLRPARSHSGLINIHVDHKARPGLERKVKITITDEVGRSVEINRFIVIREDPISTDVSPPEIIILSSITTCKKGWKTKMSCGVGNWTVLFSVQDRESGLSIIDVDDHTVSTVWTENFSETQVIRPINGKISTDCCIKRTVIIVTDNNGNTLRIPIYFPHNSTATTTKPTDHRAHSLKLTAVVVSAFACMLLLVVIVTVTIQNSSKFKCIRRSRRRQTGIQLLQKRANVV